MTKSNLLKDNKTYNPGKLTDMQLNEDHILMHAWWATVVKNEKINGWSKEDVWNTHELIVKEMISKGVKHNSPLPKTLAEHEAICIRCGKCCYLKTEEGRISNNPCEYLEGVDGQAFCRIYENRLEKNPDCNSMTDAILKNLQPNNCPYVENLNGYTGPIKLSELADSDKFKLHDKVKYGPLEDGSFHRAKILKDRPGQVQILDMDDSKEFWTDKDNVSQLDKKDSYDDGKGFELNVEVVKKIENNDFNSFSYLTAIKDGKEKIIVGETYSTNLDVKIGGNIKVSFVNLSKYTDPVTGKIWFDMWAPRVIEKTNLSDSEETANKLVELSKGEIDKKVFPLKYDNNLGKGKLSEFEEMCIQENTEEFNFALLNNWISSDDFIPKILCRSNLIRNPDNFILRKDSASSSLILLRDNENKIKKEIAVELMQH